MLYHTSKKIEKGWEIEGFPQYFFGTDKKLYHLNSQGNAKESKLNLKGYTKGYFLHGKFYSLKRLKPLIKKA